ncbi:35637_t:CDS:2, partial [Racocetra persica]
LYKLAKSHFWASFSGLPDCRIRNFGLRSWNVKSRALKLCSQNVESILVLCFQVHVVLARTLNKDFEASFS